MKVHQVQQCCCGCSLETGSKIIAWLETVCGIITAVLSIGLFFFDNNEEKRILYIGYAMTGIFYTIIGLILLAGVYNRRAPLLNVWILIALIGLVLYLINNFIQAGLVMFSLDIGTGVGILMSSLIGTLVSYYFIMVVSSFRSAIMVGNVVYM